jgi:magnesium chelatase subunit H
MISSRLSSLTLKPTSNSIVIIAGFEAFNTQLYRKSADTVMKLHPSVNVNIFTDVDITENPDVVQEKLKTCSVLFCSLLFDYSQVQWLLPKIKDIPVKFMFESAQELMSETAVGDFNMKPKEGISGPPPFVKSILKQFGSKKEEDKMAGYLSLLKIGPKVLSMVPSTGVIGERVKDIRSWLTVYSYWNQGTVQNIVSMLNYIIDTFDLSSVSKASVANKLVEAPNTAFYHPDLFEKRGYVEIGNEYIKWYKEMHSWVTKDTPRVGLLLYRKHVLSEQPYIGNLIKLMETQGIMPIPVFITG